MKRSGHLFLAMAVLTLSAPCHANEESDRLGNHGIELLNDGKIQQGTTELRRACLLDPKDVKWRIQYGDEMFRQATELGLDGNTAESHRLFKEVEEQYLTAIPLLKKEESKQAAQCYFVLGMINDRIFDDAVKGREYYKKALELNPQHAEAARQLKKIDSIEGQ